MNATTNPDDRQLTGPIRTYREVVAIMRKRGDSTITTSHIHWYEQSAFRKLRPLLEDIRDEVCQ